MRKILGAVVATFVIASASGAWAQAGVCNRATDDAKQKINDDVDKWIAAINSTDQPPEVKNAHIVLFKYNQQKSLAGAEQYRKDCTDEYRPYQDVVDLIVKYYTLGLAGVLQPHMTHVDVSELLAGYPLGGPNALIPKFREEILRGDSGTISNIIRDPFKCLTLQRSC